MPQRWPRVAGRRSRQPSGSQGPSVIGTEGHTDEVSGPGEGLSRRSFLKVGGTFVVGVATGVLGSYGTDYLSATLSPEELADAQALNAPVRAIVVPERYQALQGELWVYPGPLSQNPQALEVISGSVDNFDDFHRRMYAVGFQDADITLATLLVEGRRNSPVRVINMHARILSRRVVGTSYSVIGPGGESGTVETVDLGFNLSDRNPVARRVEISPNQDVEFGAPFFAEFNTELSRGDQEVYSVRAHSGGTWDLEWELVIDVVAAGASESESVGTLRRGAPFRTIGLQYREGGGFAYEKYAEVYAYSGGGLGDGKITFVRSETFSP
jgi:hypothetical protein